MRLTCLASILAFGSAAHAQVIANPHVKVSPKKTAALPSAQLSRDPTAAALKSKFDWEDALNDLYKFESNLAEGGRIWAVTANEWTDIRVVEGNLRKAEKHFSTASRHWDGKRYDDYLREMSQVHDVLERSKPQALRIEQMIHFRRGR